MEDLFQQVQEHVNAWADHVSEREIVDVVLRFVYQNSGVGDDKVFNTFLETMSFKDSWDRLNADWSNPDRIFNRARDHDRAMYIDLNSSLLSVCFSRLKMRVDDDHRK